MSNLLHNDTLIAIKNGNSNEIRLFNFVYLM